MANKTVGAAPSTEAHIELLTEHFGFNPKSFIDKLVYAANEHLYFLGDTLEKTILDRTGADESQGTTEAEKNEGYEKIIAAEKSTHKVLTLFENALDHMFDTIELWSLKSVFGITSQQANHLTLLHHRGLDLRKSSDGPKAIVQHNSLNKAEQRLRLKIASARASGEILDKALITAKTRLAKTEELYKQFSHVLASQTSPEKANLDVRLDSSLPPALKKVRADASVLCGAISSLRELDPLGQPLAPAPSVGAEGDVERAFDGSNRDAYLHWEVKRALEEQKKLEKENGDGDVLQQQPDAAKGRVGLKRKSTGATSAAPESAESPRGSKRKSGRGR